MSPVKSGENIRLVYILSHELYKNVLDGGAFWTRGVGFGWVAISDRGDGL